MLLKKGKSWRYLKERAGLSNYESANIWVHAVSVGEVLAAIPFLKSLKKEIPETKILLSTITHTGQEIAIEKFPEADRIMYMPWDASFAVNRVVKEIKPEVFITIETELWPIVFKALRQNGTKIIVLNGRISKNSFKGYMFIRSFMKSVLSYVDAFCMRTDLDAQRIISMGADREKVKVSGNLKFDITLPKDTLPWIKNISEPLIVAGSTHKGEEEIILKAFESVKKNIPALKLILAPRHPERFSEVEGILKKNAINFIRRSEMHPALQHSALPDVILLDTMGELSQIFSKATIAFIGGSLLPFGGHNILEPAYWSKPIIFGPHMDNFPFTTDFLEEGAALIVSNSKNMAEVIENLITDRRLANSMGGKARAIIDKNIGATEKATALVRSLIRQAQNENFGTS